MNQTGTDLGIPNESRLQGFGITAGDADLVAFVEAPMGDNIAKFALALGSAGNVHTRTGRAWTEAEFMKIVSELP